MVQKYLFSSLSSQVVHAAEKLQQSLDFRLFWKREASKSLRAQRFTPYLPAMECRLTSIPLTGWILWFKILFWTCNSVLKTASKRFWKWVILDATLYHNWSECFSSITSFVNQHWFAISIFGFSRLGGSRRCCYATEDLWMERRIWVMKSGKRFWTKGVRQRQT